MSVFIRSSALLLFIFSIKSVAQTDAPVLYTQIEEAFDSFDFELCLSFAAQAETELLQRQDTIASNTLAYLGTANYFLANYREAIRYYLRDKALLNQLGLQLSDKYSETLYNLSQAYADIGELSNAITEARVLVANDAALFGEQDEYYISSVVHLASLIQSAGNISSAEKLLVSNIRKQEKSSINTGILLNQLGDLYNFSGQYSKALKNLQESVNILEALGQDDETFKAAYASLGSLLMNMGKYAEAEEIFTRILSSTDESNQQYIATLNNMAVLYRDVGQFEEAESTLRTIAAIDSVTIGTEHPDFSITLSNLGFTLLDQQRYDEAANMLRSSMQILESLGLQGSPSYAIKLTSLAKVYVNTGQHIQALQMLEQARDIYKKTLGKKSPEFATTYLNAGNAYLQNNDQKNAEKYYKTSIKLRKSSLGVNHPAYGDALQKLADLYVIQGKTKKAQNLFGAVFENHFHQIDTYFAVLTEEERANYYYNKLRPAINSFMAFAETYHNENPELLSQALNLQLNLKGIILLASDKVKNSIFLSGDTTLINLYDRWKTEREIIAKLYSEAEPVKLDSMYRVAVLTEKELARRSSVFEQQMIRKSFDWKSIQSKLTPGEAAIEIVRYHKPGNEGMVSYAFLILTASSELPRAVFINRDDISESRYATFYANNIRFKLRDNFSYSNLFEPLHDYLKQRNINSINLAADGVYHKINLYAIYNPLTQAYLVDELDMRLVTSLRDLVEDETETRDQNFVLIGNPDYDMTRANATLIASTEVRSIAQTRGGLNRGLRAGLLRYAGDTGFIPPLPGTMVEVNQISALLNPASQAKYTNKEASEHIIKTRVSPGILHIASHGYFMDDPKIRNENKFKDNPLHYSGIILAGAENFLLNGQPFDESDEDGILTAYEALNLNLEGTKLVVLSACETGLGSVRNGEGVYGLQRAFRLAGSKNIIMSLWEVDDEATQQLMSIFYKSYIQSNNMVQAFKEAQLSLKEKYKEPFYWGAFILVGGGR